jgi:hypothetical protein
MRNNKSFLAKKQKITLLSYFSLNRKDVFLINKTAGNRSENRKSGGDA